MYTNNRQSFAPHNNVLLHVSYFYHLSIGLVLCGYLFGLDIKCDLNVQHDFLRIGCSNFVMLINCLGLVYSFSPLQTVLSDTNPYPLEYVHLASMLIDIALRVAYGAGCFWVAYNLKPGQTLEVQPSAMNCTCAGYISTSGGVVFDKKDNKELFETMSLREATQPVQSALVIHVSKSVYY